VTVALSGNEEISSSVWILPVVAVATLLAAIFTVFFCKRYIEFILLFYFV